MVFQALTSSQLMYVLPSVARFLSSKDTTGLTAVRESIELDRSYCVLGDARPTSALQNNFHKHIGSKRNRCLHQLLPDEIYTNYNLRTNGEIYELPSISSAFFKKI
jgi:hypothetical protein